MLRVIILAAVMLAVSLAASSSHAQSRTGTWRITKAEWTEEDEKGFGAFVTALGKSGCSDSIDCLRDPANPYRDTDPQGLRFIADCADFPYMLRAYYAWKNGLPFAYVSDVSGKGGDIRFSRNANRPVSRRALIDRGDGLSALEILDDVHNGISSATYRTDAAQEGGVLSDFYSPKVQPGSIRPGTAIYDVNGHVAIVYDIEEDGRIDYMDAHPDRTVTRSVFGPQFGHSPAKLGGGFKNWRPVKLVGARRLKNGRLIGGRIVPAGNEAIADFSLEQYFGNVAGASGDGNDAPFQYNGVPLGFYEYARVAVSGGKLSYNPVYELKATMRTLCNDLKDRALFVNMAIKEGIERKAQPARLPDNIYGTDEAEWEIYSTPSRDARIKTAFAAFYIDLQRMLDQYRARDPRIVYDGVFLKEDLQRMYEEEATACEVSYTDSRGKVVRLDFDTMAHRLFAFDFDPYHCVERRWGASGAELESCADNANKTRWYEAEQRLRNQIDRTYDAPMGFTLTQLERGTGASGVDEPPATDIKAMIDAIGERVPFAGMKPVGR